MGAAAPKLIMLWRGGGRIWMPERRSVWTAGDKDAQRAGSHPRVQVYVGELSQWT